MSFSFPLSFCHLQHLYVSIIYKVALLIFGFPFDYTNQCKLLGTSTKSSFHHATCICQQSKWKLVGFHYLIVFFLCFNECAWVMGLRFRTFKLCCFLSVDLLLPTNLFTCFLIAFKQVLCLHFVAFHQTFFFLLLNTKFDYVCWISLCTKVQEQYCHFAMA